MALVPNLQFVQIKEAKPPSLVHLKVGDQFLPAILGIGWEQDKSLVHVAVTLRSFNDYKTPRLIAPLNEDDWVLQIADPWFLEPDGKIDFDYDLSPGLILRREKVALCAVGGPRYGCLDIATGEYTFDTSSRKLARFDGYRVRIFSPLAGVQDFTSWKRE